MKSQTSINCQQILPFALIGRVLEDYFLKCSILP